MVQKFSRFLSIVIGCIVLLTGCSSTSDITYLKSNNSNYRVKSLVMHFTAVDYATSVRLLVDEGGLSAHYLVPQSNDPSYPHDELKVLKLVDENERAWHAGVSHWQGRDGLNDHSIGIEIVNTPHCTQLTQDTDSDGFLPSALTASKPMCIYPDFDSKQVELLIRLSKDILARNPDIEPTAVIGHSDIAPSRKQDPGPRFPWFQLYQNGIGAWYDNDTISRYWQQFSDHPASIALLQKALADYGYGIAESSILDQATVDTIEAFQMHFLPWQVNGTPDAHTAAAVFALIDKYFPAKLSALLERYEEEKINAISPPVSVVPKGQFDRVFPDTERSNRDLVNNRAVFKSYKGRGVINISSDVETQADIYINQQKLSIATTLSANQTYQYSLAKRTQNGWNSIRVENISNPEASLRISIPYPTLSDNTATWRAHFAALDDMISQDIQDGFAGAAILVAHKGEIIKREAYGYAKKYDASGNTLNEPLALNIDTLFDLASNTKIYATTLAILQLIDRGKVDVTKPIYHYLPEYTGQQREQRTIADLLGHTSGYPSSIDFFDPENALGTAYYSQNKAHTQYLLSQKIPFKTGTNVQNYSDINYMLLGTLVERITGQALDEFVEENIYTPLGLTKTLFNPLQKEIALEDIAATELTGNTRGLARSFPNIRNGVIQGEVHDENAFYSMQGVSGHAGLFSNVDDLAILSQALLNHGGYAENHLFSQSALSRFVSPVSASDNMGLGWKLAGDVLTGANGTSDKRWYFGPYASANAFGHSGWTGTATLIDPDNDLIVILLTNKKHSPILSQNEEVIFTGDKFETGKYGSIMSLVYETILSHPDL